MYGTWDSTILSCPPQSPHLARARPISSHVTPPRRVIVAARVHVTVLQRQLALGQHHVILLVVTRVSTKQKTLHAVILAGRLLTV